MTAAVEILVANLKDVLSVPVQSVVEKSGKFYCWVNTPAGPEKRPVMLGMSNNTRIEIKDGLAEGDEVLLNPRAMVEEAREDERTEEKVDVKKKFGDDKPAAVAGRARWPAGRLRGAGGKGKGGRSSAARHEVARQGRRQEDQQRRSSRADEGFLRHDGHGQGRFIDADGAGGDGQEDATNAAATRRRPAGDLRAAAVLE